MATKPLARIRAISIALDLIARALPCLDGQHSEVGPTDLELARARSYLTEARSALRSVRPYRRRRSRHCYLPARGKGGNGWPATTAASAARSHARAATKPTVPARTRAKRAADSATN